MGTGKHRFWSKYFHNFADNEHIWHSRPFKKCKPILLVLHLYAYRYDTIAEKNMDSCKKKSIISFIM